MNVQHKLFKGDSLNGEWVITIGNFDGYHLGHQQLVRQVLNDRDACNLKGGILTFQPHPKKVLQAQIPFRQLYDDPTKFEFLEESGLDACFVIPFTQKFSKLSSHEFLEKLFQFIRLRKIIVGYDFNFGKSREGSANLMKEEAAKQGIDFLRMEAFRLDDITVSSTMIRRMLFQGEFDSVARYLGRKWSINGTVQKGKKLGHTLGFPTLNLEPEIMLPLRKGVYTCRVELKTRLLNGVCNVGINPTFNGSRLKVEAHLFDFAEEAYGEVIKIYPERFLRDETRFESVDALKQQIQADVETARTFFRNGL
jgi:riboflavin kinase / FMN adenylyltransferase